jgi:hypothetical protein
MDGAFTLGELISASGA